MASIFSISPSLNDRAPKLVRRLRTAPLPTAPIQGGAAPASLAWVEAFLDQLVGLPLMDWLAIGQSLVADRERLPVRQRAWDELASKLALRQLGVVAWSVRDAVDTAVYIASRQSHRWCREDRGSFAAAHGAAEAAALALLARDGLPQETYRALTAPFATYIGRTESPQQG